MECWNLESEAFIFFCPPSATQDMIGFSLIPSWHSHSYYSSSLNVDTCFLFLFDLQKSSFKMIELKANRACGCVLNECCPREWGGWRGKAA